MICGNTPVFGGLMAFPVLLVLVSGAGAAGPTRISAPLPENVAATLDRAEEDVFWQDVTLRLDGALPNDNSKLDDELELYLGRLPDPPTSSGRGPWRKYVLGYSAFYDPRLGGGKGRRLYNWMDDEGVLTEAREDGGRIRLVVDVTIHPDHWICGGTLQATIDATREGDKLSGTFTGFFDKAATDAAGPAGRKATKGTVTGTVRAKLLPSPVAGHVPLKPGEHPRLLFRASDLPALKERLRTPEGQAMFALLKQAAGDGGKMGTWHGYAFGLLHQLTGEAKWADLARQFAEGAIAGKVKSSRYGWFTRDGGYMRAGPSAAAVAAAYDMCYDAWPADFRRQVARKIQDRICPNMVLEHDRGESDPQFTPRSNHYGLWQGGAGTCVVAIRGDAGTDEKVLRRSHRIFLRRLKRGLEVGFGDHGWFYEGTFCGRFPTTGGFNAYLQALRVAEGKDFVTHCPEARWLTTKWIYEMLRTGGRMTYHSHGMYSNLKWNALSGDFAQGFGVAPAEHRPGVLWFYRHVMEPDGVKEYDVGDGDKAAMNAAYAFVNWPIGMTPADPAEALGHALWDREAGFFVFRSGWRGEGDVVVSMYGQPIVMGMGLQTSFAVGIPPEADVTGFHEGKDGTVVVSAVNRSAVAGTPTLHCLAVDFSGVCGAPALLVGTAGPAEQRKADTPPAPAMDDADRRELAALLAGMRKADAPKAEAPEGKPNVSNARVRLGGRELHVQTIQKGAAPQVKVVGEGGDARIVVGKRSIRFDPGPPARIVLGPPDAGSP